MTALECRIDFEVKYNNLNATLDKGLSKEMIDWWINEGIELFVNSNVPAPKTQVFEATASNLSKIESLVRIIVLPLEKREDGLIAYLPSLFKYHLSGVAKMCCNSETTLQTFNKTVATFSAPVNDTSVEPFKVTIDYTENGASRSYDLITLTDFTDLPVRKKDGFMVNNLITDLHTEEFSIYFESYDSKEYRNKIIVVPNNPTSIQITAITVYKIEDNSVLENGSITTKEFKSYKTNDVTNKKLGLIASNVIDTKSENPYITGNNSVAHCVIENGVLRLLKSQNSMGSAVILTFIRNPRKVSSIFNVGFEIGSNESIKKVNAGKVIDLALAKLSNTELTRNSEQLKENLLFNN